MNESQLRAANNDGMDPYWKPSTGGEARPYLSESQILLKNLQEKIEKLKSENEKLRNGLEFYANEENWAQIIDGVYNLGKIWIEHKHGIYYDAITLECGAYARSVLTEIEGGK